jgi:hypothetical protein
MVPSILQGASFLMPIGIERSETCNNIRVFLNLTNLIFTKSYYSKRPGGGHFFYSVQLWGHNSTF